jgi:hypothetical protein
MKFDITKLYLTFLVVTSPLWIALAWMDGRTVTEVAIAVGGIGVLTLIGDIVTSIEGRDR